MAITEARLFYRPALAEVTTLSEAKVTQGLKIDLTHVVDMTTHYLPPGLDIVYYWSITNAMGLHYDTEPQTFLYQDGRFSWRSLTGGQVTVYYYSGNEDFGRDLREAFHFLTAMRLDNQLAERAGREAVVRTATLSSAQRDLLREAFKVVKQFRDFLRRHYNFAMF